jgi:hypothetical protein
MPGRMQENITTTRAERQADEDRDEQNSTVSRG